MKKVLEIFFNRLGCEKGEDIFEYGFGSFDEEKYAKYLLDKGHISKSFYNEIMEEQYELFQMIDAVDFDNYDKCLGVFAEYVTETFNEEQIADLLMRFFG